jgi:hypothetical protein
MGGKIMIQKWRTSACRDDFIRVVQVYLVIFGVLGLAYWLVN